MISKAYLSFPVGEVSSGLESCAWKLGHEFGAFSLVPQLDFWQLERQPFLGLPCFFLCWELTTPKDFGVSVLSVYLSPSWTIDIKAMSKFLGIMRHLKMRNLWLGNQVISLVLMAKQHFLLTVISVAMNLDLASNWWLWGQVISGVH